MPEDYEVEVIEQDKENHRKSRSSSKPRNRESDEQYFVKNIPSYVSCIVTTGSNLLLCMIFTAHCVYYCNMHLTLAILFVIANTAITFVGTFKANV